MQIIRINTGCQYEVHVGAGLLFGVGEKIRALLPKAQTAAIVTDETVSKLYLNTVIDSLTSAEIEHYIYCVPPGEASKSGQQYLSLLDGFARDKLTRTDCALALGGGVIGDLAGFAAATYLRGLSYVQLPTTLLAMVDSSVGGKTAIDLPSGKNLAGVFYQPSLVIADTDCIKTLPEPVFNDGIAEIIKYGMLCSVELLNALQHDASGLDLLSVIAQCVCIKRDIVEKDEFDHNLRMLLNFGHTIGHAIEKSDGYNISHGQAVAVGMAIDTRAAVRKSLCPPQCQFLLESLLDCYNLPKFTEFDSETLYKAALGDKKRAGSDITIVTPRDLGQSELITMPISSLMSWIETGLEA